MNTSTITKSALALALGLCASAALADRATPVSENFQGAAFNNGNTNTVAGITANNLTWADPDGYTAVESGVLKVDATTDDPTTAAIANDAKTKFDSAVTGNRSASFTADVAFTPSKTILGSSDIADGGDLKFALFAYDDGTSTNLYYYTSGTAASTGIEVTENALHALVVNFSDDNGTRKFSVSYNGSAAAGPYAFANNAQVGQVEFAGNGSVDNIAFAYDKVPFTMSWTADSASYTVNGTTYSLAGETSPFTYYGEPGDVVSISGSTGYKSGTATVTADSTTDLVLDTYSATFSDYFPRTATEGQNGSADHPYEIADEDDLIALKDWVARTNTCENLVFVQTADIALTAAWEGIGPNAGKDLVNGTNKNIPLYESEAFSGTYDGGDYTISNFQMANGCDYGALFNSVNNATIKNLKISWGASTLTPGSSGDTGATFVGVARGSTLQNLTTLAGTVTTVTAAKDMGGIVGYLMTGSTVESCTNEINVASSGSNRKCGGIAIITQDEDASGTATIRNCKNSGTVTATNKGGLIGYANVATTIDGCENTAEVQLMHVQGTPTITVTGTNKGHSGVKSNDKSGGVSGLNFATVSGDVATFVADNALALNGEYKVMSAGATATYAFAEAGTIAFDTALFTPTYAITAAEGLTLTDATSGTVTTYTATVTEYTVTVSGDTSNLTATWTVNGSTVSAPSVLNHGDSYSVTFAPATGYKFSDGQTTTFSGTATGAVAITAPLVEALPSYSAGDKPVEGEGGSDYTISTEEATYLNTLVGTKGATDVEDALKTISAENFSAAVLLNQDITETGAGTYSFDVTKITKSGTTVTVSVKLTRSGTRIGGINGTLVLQTCATPTGTYTDAQTLDIDGTAFAGDAAEATANFTFTGVTGDSNKFFKAVIR